MKRKEFIVKMRDVLRKRRDALRRVLRGELSELNVTNSGVGDTLDFASDSDSDEISSQLAVVEGRELENIEYALERLKAGRYGVCEGCGTDIPTARLQALPYATTCIHCQRNAERSHPAEAKRIDWSAIRDEFEEDRNSLSAGEIEAAEY